jgi:hypothetical protein
MMPQKCEKRTLKSCACVTFLMLTSGEYHLPGGDGGGSGGGRSRGSHRQFALLTDLSKKNIYILRDHRKKDNLSSSKSSTKCIE